MNRRSKRIFRTHVFAAAVCLTLGIWLVLSLPAQAGPGAPIQTPAPTSAVYLPALMRAPTPFPTNTPQANTVYVMSDHGQESGGSYYVYGEVLNNQAATVCSVKLAGRFYNAEGKFIDTTGGYVMLSPLRSQQRAPFALTVFLPPAPIARHEVHVDSYEPCNYDYRPITVVGSEMRRGIWGPELHGEVYNHHDVALDDIDVVVTFYDPYGHVWYTASGWLIGEYRLEPGQTGYFTLGALDADLVTERWIVQAQGQPSVQVNFPPKCGQREYPCYTS